jgi:hypothetical protein
MSPDYQRFIASIGTADRNVVIIFCATLLLLGTYKIIDWYPVKWQKVARIAAQTFAIILLAATVYISL